MNTPLEKPILIPVPEPETYAMLLAGLGLIGFMARRKKEASEKSVSLIPKDSSLRFGMTNVGYSEI